MAQTGHVPRDVATARQITGDDAVRHAAIIHKVGLLLSRRAFAEIHFQFSSMCKLSGRFCSIVNGLPDLEAKTFGGQRWALEFA
jgi:hypothetical protein